MRIHVDLETRSMVDLRKTGVYPYAADPSTEVLILAHGNQDGVYVCTDHDRIIEEAEHIRDSDCTVHAFNASFERAIFRDVLGVDIPLERWRCTMVQAYSRGFNGGLKQVGDQLKCKAHKDSAGTALINKFSKMEAKGFKQPDEDPEAFNQFIQYCAQDVRAEVEIYEALQ